MRIKVPERSTLEPGIHHARLESVEEASSDRGQYLRWMFSIKYGGETIRRVAHSSMSFSERSKAHGWLQAIIGRQLSPGETIDLDALLPIGCRILIKPSDDGYDKVDDVLGSENRRQVGSRSHVPPQDDDADVDDDLPF